MNRLFFATNAFMVSAVLALSPMANPKSSKNNPDTGKFNSHFVVSAAPGSQRIILGCKNPGSRQGVSKTPHISNTSGKSIRIGATLYWAATDGDKGNVILLNDLAPSASVQAAGSAGQGYNCQAWTFQ
jgi:hypothetical protein